MTNPAVPPVMLMLAFCLGIVTARPADSSLVPLELGSMVLRAPSHPTRHIEALGERGGVWGSTGGGLEAWAYPFQMFDRLTIAVIDSQGLRSEELFDHARVQVSTPHLAQLECAGTGWNLTATLFYPRSTEGGVILLDVRSGEPLELRIRFRPSLAPMLLSRGGDLRRDWDPERREIVFRDPARGAELRVGSPAATRSVVGRDGREELWLRIPEGASGREPIPLRFGMGWELGPSAAEVMDRLGERLPLFVKSAVRHYQELMAGAPVVNSPDPEFNAALAWSVVSLDQLRVHNPFLGYGLVSGYSRSGSIDSPRPRYCWFFEEPTLASWAYHRVGLSGHVAEALRFLQRYQRPDGKTVHEVTQSLKYHPDFFETYRYAYMHSDSPVYYLLAYGHHYRSTGDAEFVRDQWGRIRRTVEWCFSNTDPDDGLLMIAEGDWGSAESSTRVWKDTQMEGMWVRALDGVEQLAGLMGEEDLAVRCRDTRALAMLSIEGKLWNEQAGNYVWGLNRAGEQLGSFVPHHSLSYWLSSFRPDRVRRALVHLAGSDFRTDWGVRTLPRSDPGYDPGSYQKGSVWPVWNAGAIVSDFRHGRSVEGFRNLMAMARLRTLESLGPMPEVLRGDRLVRLEEGVPHQMFSELAVVNGFYDGLLGLEVDVPKGLLRLAPSIPPAWGGLEVARIPVGDGQLDVGFERSLERLLVKLELRAARPMELQLAPHLPAGASVAGIRVNGARAGYREVVDDSGLRVELTLPSLMGAHEVDIRYSGGIEMMPLDEPLELGAESRGLRVIRSGLEEGMWMMAVEGLPGRVYPLQIHTRRVPLRSLDAPLTDRTVGGFRVQLRAPEGSATNAAGYARWETSIQFLGK